MKNETQKRIVVKSFEEMNNLLKIAKEDTDEETQGLTPQKKRLAYQEYRNCTYNIVSLMGFLIGVPKENFGEAEEERLAKSVYEQCSENKEARIIRNLCRIRTAMEKHFVKINRAFRQDLKNIGSLPELIPSEAVEELSADGVSIYKSKPDINEYMVILNTEIVNRINSVSKLFPEWVRWDYLRPVFLMPGGTKMEGIKKAGDFYNEDRNRFPFQCWLNWDALASRDTKIGNILHNDEKFLTALYIRNEDRFENLSLVRDVGKQTMRHLSELLEHSRKVLVVVDCENSDAVKLAAALSSLPASQAKKIKKVLLFDSEYTTDQWRTLVDRTLMRALNGDTLLPVEHEMVPRLNRSKSQLDMTLAVRASKEVYRGGVDGMILVSSDSDYWALIKQLEEVKFLVMLEKEKTGHAIMDTLALNEIPFCFLDDFCTHASYSIKTGTLISGIQAQIDAVLEGKSDIPLNVAQMMENVLRESWITMTEKEKEIFYNRYLLHMKLNVAADGSVSITIET